MKRDALNLLTAEHGKGLSKAMVWVRTHRNSVKSVVDGRGTKHKKRPILSKVDQTAHLAQIQLNNLCGTPTKKRKLKK